MSKTAFPVPKLNEKLPSPEKQSDDILNFLALRRSTPIKTFDPHGAGPSNDEIAALLQIAMRVPDHRRLGPWRTLIVSGDHRQTLANELVNRFTELNPNATDKEIAVERDRMQRAPTCVIVISSPVDDGKTPAWEQELSAGALCMNLLYVLHASGYAASWLSEWWAFDSSIAKFLGLNPHERIAGNIFIGQSRVDLFERPRPDLSDKITEWTP